MLKAGQEAPEFVLPDADMEPFELSACHGIRHVVLFFYPRDNTPACTLQAIEFSDLEDVFAKHDTLVLGVCPDDCLSHAEFRDKHGLSVRLLADTEQEVGELYGVWQDREVDGIRKRCALRSTFVIDKQGIVRHALYGVNPRGHAAEVINLVKGLK